MADLRPLGSGLTQLLDNWGLTDSFRVASALRAWDEMVGSAIALVARPLRIEKGTLWIAVKTQAWAQELNFQKPVILQRLNERIGYERFQNLRFTVRAQLPPPQHAPPSDTEENPACKPADIELTDSERQAVEQLFANVPDERLRTALIRARLASLQYEKWCAQQGWRRCRGCGCYHQDPESLCFLCRGVR